MKSAHRLSQPGRMLTLLFAIAVAGTGSAWPQDPAPATAAGGDPDAVVIRVGEEEITAAEFEQMLTALPPQFAVMLKSMGRKGFAEQYANLLSLFQEGLERNVEQNEQFRRMMEFDRKVLLAQVTMNELVRDAADISSEEISYYYQSHESEFEQRKVRGVFIPFATRPAQNRSGGGFNINDLRNRQYTEQEAQRRALQLRAYINAGSDMGELARTESKHETASKGGDFGYVGRADLKPELSNAVYNLQINRVSGPVRDEGGFYIFRVEEKRVRPLEEIEPAIRRVLSAEKLNGRLEGVKREYPITINQEYFAAEEPPAPAGQ